MILERFKKPIDWKIDKASWFKVVSDGSNFLRFTCRVKTRPNLKPYVPDTPHRDNGPVWTEAEEIKRGEAGDPLLLSQIAATMTKDNQDFEYRLWAEQKDEDENGQISIKKVHNDTSKLTNSFMRVPGRESGFYCWFNLFVQERYDLAEQQAISSLPPTIQAMEKLVDGKGIKEPMRSNIIVKIQDRFNWQFLGVQANLRACWNTVIHVGNLEERQFDKILTKPNLKAVLQYDCMQQRWHVEYGDFSGTKYVMYSHLSFYIAFVVFVCLLPCVL